MDIILVRSTALVTTIISAERGNSLLRENVELYIHMQIKYNYRFLVCVCVYEVVFPED